MDLVEKSKASTRWTGKCLERQIWRSFFMPFEDSFMPLIWKVKVSYQAHKLPCWISSLIRAFQTGNDSYTTCMCLQYVFKSQNHSDTSQYQMELMPFPIYFNAVALSSLTPHSCIPHNILFCWFSRAIARFLRYLSDLSKISFESFTAFWRLLISFGSTGNVSNYFGNLS